MTTGAATAAHAAPSDVDDELLVLRGVWKTYSGPIVLRDVDLTLRCGRVHALVGHNGSGKSTLIKIMAGVERAEPAGTAVLDGESIELGDTRGAHRQRLHFIHQGLNILPELSALDNVALGIGYPRRLGVIDWRAHRERVEALLTRVGAEFDVTCPVRQLLPNQQVVVAIARAMAHWTTSRSVLVIDEATAALQAPEVEQLFTAIGRAAQEGAAVLFVSHRLDEVMRFADDVTVLRDGEVVMNARRGELTEAGLLDALLGAPEPTAASGGAGSRPVRVGGDVRVTNLTTDRLLGVDFTIGAGEIVGAAGLDGSGREQLADAVYGAVPRASGEVLVSGRKVAAAPRASVSARVGLVPADRAAAGVIAEMPVRVNETLPRLSRYRRPWKLLDERRERRDVSTHLDGLGMPAGTAEKPIKHLSGGNQQKIVVSRWLRQGVNLLVLDEPVQGIDVGAKEKIFALVRAAAEQGTAVLVCSAVDEDLAALCDRVLVFDRGTVNAELQGPDLTVAAIAAASHAFNNDTDRSSS